MLNDIKPGLFAIETKSGSNGKEKYKAQLLNFDTQSYTFLICVSVRYSIVSDDLGFYKVKTNNLAKMSALG